VSFLFPSSTITFDAALRDVARGSPKARVLAAHTLGNASEPTELRRAVDALIAALDDDHPEVRAEACSSLGGLGEPTAIPSLVKRLDDGAPTVRESAAIALGTIGHADGFEPLALVLKEGPADLRFQAATSLAEIDARRAFEPLAAALDDRDPQVVGAAALSLGAIGSIKPPATGNELQTRARAALLEVLDHPNDATRFDVAYALSELGDPTGRGILVRALPDPDRAWDAVAALATLGTPADVEALGRALTDRKVPPEATLLAAGSILRLGGNSDAGEPTGDASEPTGEQAPLGCQVPLGYAARRVLIAGLAARKTHVRGLAIEQLGEVGGAWAAAPLEKLAQTGKGGELLETIAAALRAIAGRATSKPE